MPLQAPRLDDRDFESLFEEARARIPRYTPEWTDWNESDPGITLLQLQAWLTETILYRLNQLPDLNYVKFLELLGVEQRPAQPAQADLTFILKPEKDVKASEILIDKGKVISVSARDLEEPLYFETDRTLTAISARLELLVHLPDIANPDQQPADVTQDNDFDGRTFHPFGDPVSSNAALLFGFTSNLPFSREEIGLQIYLAEEGQALLAEPEKMACGPTAEEADAPQLDWQWWDSTDWADLDVTGDDTRNLTRSGQVFFRVPGQIPATPYDRLGLPMFQEEEEDEEPPRYYWLRVLFKSGMYAKAPKIDRIVTNTVRATAALTVFDEAVGSSNGEPNQIMSLRYSPVLADPPLELEVDEGQGPEPWTEVSDFYGAGPDDAVYTLNRSTGKIAFGDGLRGRIPVAGRSNVIARTYRYGGGRVGNVGAGTITDLVTPIPEAEEVTNFRPAVGGADEEALDETRLRGPRDALKTRNRAVTLEDFALLAAETPGALVARAYAYAAWDGGNGDGGKRINVVVQPQSEDAKPVPSEASREMVCRYLDERRLVTTEVCVLGPPYHDIDVLLELYAHDDADLKTVKNAIIERLGDYFHPLRGGEDGTGWPFGRDVYHSELVREIMVLDGVLRVESLKLRKLLPRAAVGQPPYFATMPTLTQQTALLTAERAAFPDAGPPEGQVLKVTIPGETDDDPTETRYYVAAVYDCCDLPVTEGALLALRSTDISVSYQRERGS